MQHHNLSVQEYKAVYENKTIVKSIEDFRGPTARLITDGERAIALAQSKLALFTSEKKRSLLGSKHNIHLMLNMYTLSHVMRCKVFVFGRVKTSNVIKEQHMQPNRQTKSKVNRTIKSTPIVDFTECNKECTYYYNVAKYNRGESTYGLNSFGKSTCNAELMIAYKCNSLSVSILMKISSI